MAKYKFTSDNKESRFYNGNTRKTNETFLQVGDNYMEVDDVKKEQAKADFKKKLKEKKLKEVDAPVETDVAPSAEKLMSNSRAYLVRYLKSQGLQTNYANMLADKIFDLSNKIIDKGYSNSIDRYLGVYLQKFYKSIGMGG